MGAINPTAIQQESAGSMKAHIATFAIGSAPGDTWASGIEGIVFAVAQGIGSATGANVTCSFSGETITFGGGVSATQPAISCLVLSHS